MYNGIGLTTPRGSGTNGYVQTNLANVLLSKEKSKYLTEEDIKKAEAEINRKPNQELLEHDKKRGIELKCMELQDLMEDQGYKEQEVVQKVNEYRTLLTEQLSDGKVGSGQIDQNGRQVSKNSHVRAELMVSQKDKMRKALGIKEEFVDGSCLDKLKQKTKETEDEGKKGWEERFEHENRLKEGNQNEKSDGRADLIAKVEKDNVQKESKKRKHSSLDKKKTDKKHKRSVSSSSGSDTGSDSSGTDSSESDSEADSSSDSSSETSSASENNDSSEGTPTEDDYRSSRDVSPSYKARRRITSRVGGDGQRREKRSSADMRKSSEGRARAGDARRRSGHTRRR